MRGEELLCPGLQRISSQEQIRTLQHLMRSSAKCGCHGAHKMCLATWRAFNSCVTASKAVADLYVRRGLLCLCWRGIWQRQRESGRELQKRESQRTRAADLRGTRATDPRIEEL